MTRISKYSPLFVQAELTDGRLGVVQDCTEWQREDGSKFLRLAVNILDDQTGSYQLVGVSSDHVKLTMPILGYVLEDRRNIEHLIADGVVSAMASRAAGVVTPEELGK
jgi:hypothetical protein